MNRKLLILALTSAFALGSCRSSSEVPVYHVEGAVAHPGEFPSTPNLTLWEAVRLAQPMEERCDLSRVELQRESAGELLRITVDLTQIEETGDTTTNVEVLEGDVIRVP